MQLDRATLSYGLLILVYLGLNSTLNLVSHTAPAAHLSAHTADPEMTRRQTSGRWAPATTASPSLCC